MATKLNPNSPVLRKDLDGAIDAILAGMDNMFQDQNKQLRKRFESIDEQFESIDERFESIDEQLAELKTEQRYIKDEIKSQKADFSTVPSRKDFNRLEARVNRYHPVN